MHCSTVNFFNSTDHRSSDAVYIGLHVPKRKHRRKRHKYRKVEGDKTQSSQPEIFKDGNQNSLKYYQPAIRGMKVSSYFFFQNLQVLPFKVHTGTFTTVHEFVINHVSLSLY